MNPLAKFFKALAAEYGDDAVRVARQVLGRDAEPAQIESAVKTIAKPRQQVRVPAPPKATKPLALPAPKGKRHPVREGYKVRDRGPEQRARYQVIKPDGEGDIVQADEGDAWSILYNRLNPEGNKTKGGQFLPQVPQLERSLGVASPEAVSSRAFLNALPQYSTGRFHATEAVDMTPEDAALHAWWTRAVPKYLKTDFGTDNDPLRALAERNLLHMPDTTPQDWDRLSRRELGTEPIGYYTVPPHASDDDFHFGPSDEQRQGLLSAAPWLAKQPVTDPLYSFGEYSHEDLGLPHVIDEVRNAMRASETGLPNDLAIRPESLNRMSFPQAVERVGRIGQWRAAEAERAQLAEILDNPAIQTFKEYPEAGYRWVELTSPKSDNAPPDALAKALKAEGDIMGHCVGGYCDDVVSGRSRIFSLRDHNGKPHVTVETSPPQYRFSDVRNAVGDDLANQWLEEFDGPGSVWDALIDRAGLRGTRPEDIVQIKGKQNRAPVDEYLPYVQDFVKSGQWGNVGDLGNTNLMRLPDGRYIGQQHLPEITNSPAALELFGSSEDARKQLQPWNVNTFSDEDWNQTKHLFEGYAVGGSVSADRCFSRHPMKVR